MEDEAGAEEADALDDIRRDLAFVGADVGGQDGGHEGERRRSRGR